ncbi:MAG: Xaa-Pro peptidase family protein [Candidatus Aenigmatarchaeota archaeon]
MDPEIVTKIKNIIQEKNLDLIIIKNSNKIDPTFFWLTGIDKGSFEYSDLFVQLNRIKLIVSHFDIHIANQWNIPTIISKKGIFERHLKLYKYKRIGVNYSAITKSDFDNIKKLTRAKLIDISKPLSFARGIKTRQEIKRIKKACKISSSIMEQISNFIIPGQRENQIAAKIQQLILENGCISSFDPIVASGSNSAYMHHSITTRKIRHGDLILIDFGVMYKKYCSDISRTFVLGRPNTKQKKMFDVVQIAQQLAFDKLKSGVDGKIIYDSVKRFLDSKYPKCFIHSLGHGIGIDVHDFPRDIGKTNLKTNMIFTIEPGVYIPHFGGIRLEDVVLITKNRYKLLTKPDVEFII